MKVTVNYITSISFKLVICIGRRRKMVIKKYIRNLQLYLSFGVSKLKGGYTDSSESTLVNMTHCWKSHVTA